MGGERMVGEKEGKQSREVATSTRGTKRARPGLAEEAGRGIEKTGFSPWALPACYEPRS